MLLNSSSTATEMMDTIHAASGKIRLTSQQWEQEQQRVAVGPENGGNAFLVAATAAGAAAAAGGAAV